MEFPASGVLLCDHVNKINTPCADLGQAVAIVRTLWPHCVIVIDGVGRHHEIPGETYLSISIYEESRDHEDDRNCGLIMYGKIDSIRGDGKLLERLVGGNIEHR